MRERGGNGLSWRSRRRGRVGGTARERSGACDCSSLILSLLFRCDSSKGPAGWTDTNCNIADFPNQSPIDVCGATVEADLPTLDFPSDYSNSKTYKLEGWGAYIDAGSLSMAMTAGKLIKKSHAAKERVRMRNAQSEGAL